MVTQTTKAQSVLRLQRSRCFALMVIVCLILSTGGRCVWADDEIAAELRQLGEEYDSLCETMYADSSSDQPEYASEMTDATFLEHYYRESSRPNPDSVMLPRFLTFAEKHSNSPLAFDALAFVVWRGGPATGTLHATPWKSKEQAIDVVMANHMDDPRLVHLFDILSGSIPSLKTETFLRMGLQRGRDLDTRASACLALTKYLHNQTRYQQRSTQLNERARIDSFLDRHWKLIVTPHLKSFPYDHDKVSEEVDRLLNDLATKYSELDVPESRLSGPGRVFLQSVPRKQPRTYGDLAHSLKITWSELGPGNKAPEIVGRDAELKEFRLSDYQGKVVLLTFSANWCEPCKRLYPVHRALVEKFDKERFAMLSVNRDESIDTLKTSLASGEITWRCWWDGIDGPINDAWKIAGTPAIFLLDHQHVIQEVDFHQYSSPDDFADAINKLLGKIPKD